MNESLCKMVEPLTLLRMRGVSNGRYLESIKHALRLIDTEEGIIEVGLY
jgi:hypothetical protein